MAVPARRPATLDDLLALDETVCGELVDGELVVSPRPRSRHGRTQGALASAIGGPFDHTGEPGGWWFVVEPLLALPGALLSPDLAAWRRDRVPDLPDTSPVDVPPDWVCEVLSPATARFDRTTKADRYLAGGVGWMWLVELDAATIEVWEARDGAWSRRLAVAKGARARLPPFDALELDVARLLG